MAEYVGKLQNLEVNDELTEGHLKICECHDWVFDVGQRTVGWELWEKGIAKKSTNKTKAYLADFLEPAQPLAGPAPELEPEGPKAKRQKKQTASKEAEDNLLAMALCRPKSR